MKGVLEHEQQLFVLMDANARTGRKGGGGLVSVERKVLGAYGRDTLNGNGDRLLSITNNHGLALFKSFFSTAKKAISHYVRRRGKQKNDYIFTRQRGRNVVQDVTVHLQSPFLPISDHNIHRQSICKTVWSFYSQPTGEEGKETATRIYRRRLINYPHLRQEVASVFGNHFGAVPPSR